MSHETDPIIETPGNPTFTPTEPGARESMENPGNPAPHLADPEAHAGTENPGNQPA